MITIITLTILTPFILSYFFPPAICGKGRDNLISQVRLARRRWRLKPARQVASDFLLEKSNFVLSREIDHFAECLIRDVPSHWDYINQWDRQEKQDCNGGICATTWKPNKK